MINSGYRKAQEPSDQVKADLAIGRDRAEQAEQARTNQQTDRIQPATDGTVGVSAHLC